MFEKHERVGVCRIGIIFTNRKSNDIKATVEMARAAHEKGIILLVVGIGSEVDDVELRAIAGRDELLFRVPSYDDLVRLTMRLTAKIRAVANTCMYACMYVSMYVDMHLCIYISLSL